jgi:penicillin-insensitive murein endopeptidase
MTVAAATSADSAAPAASERINASVGAGGVNAPADVRVVQDLLNRGARAGLAVDGVCGTLTRDAIVSFQSGFLSSPDGRIDPDGVTLRRLVAAARDHTGKPRSDPATASGPTDGLSLQQLGRSGRGYYSYAAADRQYGTDEMLRLIMDTAARLDRSSLEVGVGDISFAQGGEMPPHKTHRTGRNVDLRPLRVDNAHGPTSIGDPTYSREGTRALIQALLANSSVQRILFNDTEIQGVRRFPGHDNHLHVEIR